MAKANLYVVTDDIKKVSKNISKPIKSNINITYKDTTEFIHPVIRLSYDGSWNMRDCNYIYLDDKNRYYFVKSHKMLPGKIIEYSLEVDVLKSHELGIRQLRCTVSRNENLANGYLHDSSYKTYAYQQVTCKMYPRSINQDSIILMTVG